MRAGTLSRSFQHQEYLLHLILIILNRNKLSDPISRSRPISSHNRTHQRTAYSARQPSLRNGEILTTVNNGARNRLMDSRGTPASCPATVQSIKPEAHTQSLVLRQPESPRLSRIHIVCRFKISVQENCQAFPSIKHPQVIFGFSLVDSGHQSVITHPILLRPHNCLEFYGIFYFQLFPCIHFLYPPIFSIRRACNKTKGTDNKGYQS